MPISRLLAPALIGLTLLLPVSTSMAGEISSVINGKSFHLGASTNWNEDNVGLGIEYAFDARGRWKPVMMFNGFVDSSDRMSYMAGGGLHRNLYTSNRLRGLYLDVGLNAFVMTRDDVDGGRPFPGVLPSLTLGNDYGGFNLTYLPKLAVERMTSARMADQSIRGIVFLQFKLNVSRLLND